MINEIYWVIKFLRLLKKDVDSTVISNFFKPLKSGNFNLHFIKNKASEKNFLEVSAGFPPSEEPP